MSTTLVTNGAGADNSAMNLRDSVLIQRNAIGEEDLQFLKRYVRRARRTDSAVSNFEDEAAAEGVEWVINKDVRDTQQVHLTKAMVDKLRDLDDASITNFIDPFYQIEVLDREPSSILHYGVGGHYIPHVDAETLYKDDDGLELWEKTLDRDLSVVYFLNDDFAGGELFFPALDLLVKPEAGMLVCFPSDHNFIHCVKPVSAGHRFTIVTWMRVNGMPAVEWINQFWMDEYQRHRPKQIEQPPRLGKGGGVLSPVVKARSKRRPVR